MIAWVSARRACDEEKYTNWELSACVPFIVSAPHKAASHGCVTTALTESVDAYPTVAALAGLPVPAIDCPGCVEGDDASPLLDNPDAPQRGTFHSTRAALSMTRRATIRAAAAMTYTGAFSQYSVWSPGWRYTGGFHSMAQQQRRTLTLRSSSVS